MKGGCSVSLGDQLPHEAKGSLVNELIVELMLKGRRGQVTGYLNEEIFG